jgi:hypothetical protein
MAYSKISDLNSLFNLIYEDALFVAREQNLMTQLVTNYSARGWMARKISIYPEIVAEAVAEGEDFSNPTTFNKTLLATLTPGEVMSQVVLTDRRIETDPDDARRDASLELGNSIGTKIDKDLVGNFSSFSAGVGTAGSSLTLDNVAAGLSKLRKENTPNPIYVVLHPYGWHDVWNELGTPAAHYAFQGEIANQALRSFFVGDWLNVQWFISANISIDDSDDAVGAIFNPQSLAFDSRKAPLMEPERDASLRAWELNMSAGYAHGVRRDAFGQSITHDATAPA